MLVDFSSERVPSSPKVKMAGSNPVLFKPGDVQGIMLHQTACLFGDRDNDWLGHRALKVAAHITVFKKGLVAVSAPLSWVMHHGNAPNPYCWGIEVEGYGELPLIQREGLAEAFEYLMVQPDQKPRYLWAHRQSSINRRGDPGAPIWEAGMRLALHHGLRIEPERVWGTGRPIPKDWDWLSQKAY